MRALIAATILAISGVVPTPAVAQDHSQPHQTVPEVASTTRYPTDAPLRQGMRNIRVAVDGLGHYEAGHAAPSDAVRLAGEVEDNVRYIIANCKLSPEADAALHAIIVPLMQNAGTLKHDPMKREAIPAMREALETYERQFDDPGVM